MPKLYFYHGTMNSSKTANLLMVAHNYESQKKKVLIIKPSIDTRFGGEIIKSRALEKGINADYIISDMDDMNDMNDINLENVNCIIVDEAQFLSTINVDGLRNLAGLVPVICYGLRTDYRGILFEGSKRLLELADSIQEIKTVCVDCDKKAIMNAKFYYEMDTNKKHIIKYGDTTIDLGADEKYQPMCWECWNKAN
jgi:thymidine kinase